METLSKVGKNVEETLEEILKENDLKKEDVIYTSTLKKGGLFKGNNYEVVVTKKQDIAKEVKEYLNEVTTGLGLKVNFELKSDDEHIIIKMYSDNNAILIGKNGQTLKALETLVRQMIQTKYNARLKITLDVENYKEKIESHLIRLAKKTAKEVIKTNIEVALDNMNSYERRIVHNALTNFKGITSESEGEEPNRHIVIKPVKK